MKHHEEEKSYTYVYYLVALVTGLFIGAKWIPIGGVLGLLSAAFYVNVLVKGRGEA